MSAHPTIIHTSIKDALMIITMVGKAFVVTAISLVLMLSQTACVPSINTTDSQITDTQEGFQVTENPTTMAVENDPVQSKPSTPGSQQVTPEVAETSLPTNIPEPSPTVRPHYDINDPATWPQEMQDYFNRAPEEWNNPTRQYVSTEVFDQFIQQSRCDFLSELGIDGVEGMSQEELFTEYVKWGMENRQAITLSPLEKINISNGPYALYRGDLGASAQGIAYNQDVGRAPTAEDMQILKWLAQMQTRVFGQDIRFSRIGNDSMIGTLVGVVKPTGTRADQAADCLMYYEQEGQGYWAIVAVSFTPETHLTGEQFIILNQGYKTVTYANNHESRALTSGAAREAVTGQILLDHLGTNIWLQAGGADSVPTQDGLNKRVTIELTAAGLEKAIIVIFDIPQPNPPILPWN